MVFSIDLWVALTGAIAGAAATYFARGRRRIAMAAVIGAIIAVIMGFLRGAV